MGARGFKNFFMLSVRISSDGCTRKVWRARKMRKSALYTVKSMGKFFYNRATTRICAKKPFIVIKCKILTTRKKSKQTSLLAGKKHATFYALV